MEPSRPVALQPSFQDVPLGPADPILGLTETYLKDPNPKKVNLGVGVYQDETGKTPIFSMVKEAERRKLDQEKTKSYLPIDGLKEFNLQVQHLLFGEDAPLLREGRVATAQMVAGSGALRVGASFLKKFLPQTDLWLSDPSWENHSVIFEAAGYNIRSFPYYDPKSLGLCYEKFCQALQALEQGSLVLLQANCHNPTGVDLTNEQWDEVVEIVKTRRLLPFVDLAYQGLAAGLVEDTYPVRALAKANTSFVVANSFSKNFGMYRDRVGAFSVVTENADQATRVLSQIKRVVRTMYSSPPAHPAVVIADILASPELRQNWESELTKMRLRIQEMRQLLAQKLAERKAKRDYSFVTRQRGMFSYTGLSAEVADRLREKWSIYILRSGRMCVAALNKSNIDYVCDAIVASE